MAAIAGIDPYTAGLTYGQLVDAANARRSDDWDPFSVLLSLTYNANRGEKAAPMTPDDWHPYKQKKKASQRQKRRKNAELISRIHDRLVAQGAPVRVLKAPKVIDP